MKNVICKILFIISFVLMLWTVSISIPIYCREFYFAQIESLEIDSYATKDEAKEAYNDMMDYLTLHKDFSLGKFSYTEQGEAHFKDCQRLFDINLSLMIISAVIVIILVALELAKKISLKMWGGFHASFYASLFAVAIPFVIAGLCAINFEGAFNIFHAIFFPGKSNWQFDTNTDPIINILPMQFFANCAILIICVTGFLALATVTTCGIIRHVTHKKAKKNAV